MSESREAGEPTQLRLGRQAGAKPVQASESEGCKLYARSNGKPQHVSKQEWNTIKFALCKGDSSCSVENGLNEYEETSQEAIAASAVRGNGGQNQAVAVKKKKELFRRQNTQSILHTATRCES